MPNTKKDLNDLLIINKAASGFYGSKYINDTAATTPNDGYEFFCISCVSEAVISTCTGTPDISGATLKDNANVYGRWTSVTLTSGEVLCNQIPENN